MARGTDNNQLKLAAKTRWRWRQQFINEDEDDDDDDDDEHDEHDDDDDEDDEHDDEDDDNNQLMLAAKTRWRWRQRWKQQPGAATTAAGASTTALGVGADFLFCPRTSSIILDTFLVFVEKGHLVIFSERSKKITAEIVRVACGCPGTTAEITIDPSVLLRVI